MLVDKTVFDSRFAVGCNLPQTELWPERSITLGTYKLAANDILEISGLFLHLCEFSGVVRSGGLVQAQKAAGVVTTNGNVFTADDVGSIITWSDGLQALITVFGDEQSITVSTVGIMNPAGTNHAEGFFTISPLQPIILNEAEDAVVCGIYSNSAEKFELPGGIPDASLSLSKAGVSRLNPFASREYSGPDVISIVAMNNTTNFIAQVSVTAAATYTKGGA